VPSDRHKEGYISIFMEKYTSLNQRIRNIEGTYLEFKSMIDRINKDHETIQQCKKTNQSHGGFIRELKKQYSVFHKDKKPSGDNLNRLSGSNAGVSIASDKKPVKCPKCTNIINSRLKPGAKTHCAKCGYTFRIGEDEK